MDVSICVNFWIFVHKNGHFYEQKLTSLFSFMSTIVAYLYGIGRISCTIGRMEMKILATALLGAGAAAAGTDLASLSSMRLPKCTKAHCATILPGPM